MELLKGTNTFDLLYTEFIMKFQLLSVYNAS